MGEKTITYLCDRKKCKCCSYPECNHTTDISHAKNFKRVGHIYMEKNSVNDLKETFNKITRYDESKEMYVCSYCGNGLATKEAHEELKRMNKSIKCLSVICNECGEEQYIIF